MPIDIADDGRFEFRKNVGTPPDIIQLGEDIPVVHVNTRGCEFERYG
jgi:hypothetical protein